MFSLNNVNFYHNRIISSAYKYDIKINRGARTHNFLTKIFVNIFGTGTIKLKINGQTCYLNKGSCFKLITNNMLDQSSAAYKIFKTQNDSKIISALQKIFDSKISVSPSLKSKSHPKSKQTDKTSIKGLKNDLSDKKTASENVNLDSSSAENKSQKSVSSTQNSTALNDSKTETDQKINFADKLDSPPKPIVGSDSKKLDELQKNSTALNDSKTETDQKINFADKLDSPPKPIVESDSKKLDELQKNSTALNDSKTETDQKINFADKLDSPPKPNLDNHSSSNENTGLKNPPVFLSNSELQSQFDALMESTMKENEEAQAALKAKQQKRNEELIQASKDMVAQAQAHLTAAREKNQKELDRLNK